MKKGALTSTSVTVLANTTTWSLENMFVMRLRFLFCFSWISNFAALSAPSCSLNSKDPEPKSQWKLCFKLYCLLDTESISVDSIEYLFLFEQVMKQNTDVSVERS